MAEELTYALLTPYTISKSRTGGIVARILARTKCELITTRMFAPSKELVEEYAASITDEGGVKGEKREEVRHLIQDYIRQNFSPDPITGRKRRVMMLLFKGEDAVRQFHEEVIGHMTVLPQGESIRDTYADYVIDRSGHVTYFEPAVLACPSTQEVPNKLRIWTKYSDQDGGVLDGIIPWGNEGPIEKTLVLIKPDNFDNPTIRVGNIIDLFSKSGLRIIGTKVVRMSVDQALEFYGPVKTVFLKKMKNRVEDKIQKGLESQFEFKVPNDIVHKMVDELNPLHAEFEFNKIITFMTGLDPSLVIDPKERSKPGLKRCLALIYQGPHAISKIRDILGATDPNQAKPATVRKEFGSNVMVNTAHASDSVENALREMKIIGIADNDLKNKVESFYGNFVEAHL